MICFSFLAACKLYTFLRRIKEQMQYASKTHACYRLRTAVQRTTDIIILGEESDIFGPTVMASMLFIGTFLMFLFFAFYQRQDYKKNKLLLELKEEIAGFRKTVVGVRVATRTMRAFEVQRFRTGDWAMHDALEEATAVSEIGDDGDALGKLVGSFMPRVEEREEPAVEEIKNDEEEDEKNNKETRTEEITDKEREKRVERFRKKPEFVGSSSGSMEEMMAPAEGTAVTFAKDYIDAQIIQEKDIPPFPYDLIMNSEPILLLQKGQIVQVQQTREDGWSYGFVLWEPPEVEREDDDRPSTRLIKERQAAEVAEKEGAAEPLLAPKGGAAARAARVLGEVNSEHAGWFPRIFSRIPDIQELYGLQEILGGKDVATDALAVPPTWSKASREGQNTDTKIIDITGTSESDQVAAEFNRRMGSPKNILKICRIENLLLWQSYAAKKSSLLKRARSEGADSSNYEKLGMYHGTRIDTVAKICQQG
jgi:hypothetical protein